jgi:hypothetical protein
MLWHRSQCGAFALMRRGRVVRSARQPPRRTSAKGNSYATAVRAGCRTARKCNHVTALAPRGGCRHGATRGPPGTALRGHFRKPRREFGWMVRAARGAQTPHTLRRPRRDAGVRFAMESCGAGPEWIWSGSKDARPAWPDDFVIAEKEVVGRSGVFTLDRAVFGCDFPVSHGIALAITVGSVLPMEVSNQ